MARLLHKFVRGIKLIQLRKNGFVTFSSPTSFTDEVSHKHAEFGAVELIVDRDKINKRYECIKVHYSLYWFKKHPDLFHYITWESLDDEIKRIKFSIATRGNYDGEIDINKAFERMLRQKRYMLESEVIVLSRNGEPVIIYQDDVVNTRKYKEDYLMTES